uniref:CSON008611 protein n=1 Tax=Culicoides sonorensis TaxID=179676 RepID=A0A336LYX4_CULSO
MTTKLIRTILLFLLSVSFHGIVISNQLKRHYYKSEPRIVGGFPANRNQTTFVASLRLTIEEDFFEFGAGHKCGASLITENILITAAHCLFVYYNGPFDKELRDPCEWTVVLGAYNRYTKEETTVVRSIQGITAHVDYDDYTFENDIALLFLNESVPLSLGVIETVSLNDQAVELNTSCQANGWGRVEYGGILADDLQSVNISVIDIDICNSTDSYGGELFDGMLCVGDLEGGKDSCQEEIQTTTPDDDNGSISITFSLILIITLVFGLSLV